MPSTSRTQARFMELCAHAPEKAQAPCPPKDVAKEFVQADRKARRQSVAQALARRHRGA